MGFFKHNYARFGDLSDKEWQTLLNSNKDLFEQTNKAPGAKVIGPTISASGKILGDVMSMETTGFAQVATNEQFQFYTNLLKAKNVKAALEYLFTISIHIRDVWKKDFAILRKTVAHLEDEKRELVRDEEEVCKELSGTIERHFPHIYRYVDLKDLSFEEMLKELKRVEHEVDVEKNYIQKYLNKKKKELPFLFD